MDVSWTITKVECHRIDAFKLWCWRRVPWTARKSNQSILKEISPQYSLEGLMLKPKTPILWPPDAKNWLIGKDHDAGKDWRQEEKETTADEMVGRHHWLDGPAFEQALGVGDGQGNLPCCSPWGHKELDTTEWLNWTDSAYKLNKQGDNIQPWRTPFPILNQSIVACLVLTVVSWPAYRFLRRQVRWSGIPISWRIFHSLLWSTQSKALA